MKLTEAQIQKQITQLLAAMNVPAWRVPLGGVMQAGGGFKTKNPMKGFPDLWGLIPGTQRGEIFAIEVKKPGGKLSPEQKNWAQILENAGAFYILARSVDDVRDAFAKRFG